MTLIRHRPACLVAVAVVWLAADSRGQTAQIAHGKYIVDLAHCELCHTPRDEQGNPEEGRQLMGGPLQIRPAYPNHWAAVTPRLAGQPPGTDAEVVKLLTTGIWKTGAPPSPPMPQFHMTQADAEAVLAYLKSIKP